MAIQVLGTYSTEQEAIDAIDVHALGGYLKENMTMLAKTDIARSLKEQTNVTVKSNQPIDPEDEESEGVVDKLKDIFSNEDEFKLHTHEDLVDFGLTDIEATQALKAVENGKIVVFADDELRMGHDDNATIDENSMK